jgi:hypothetical protein
VKTAYRLSLIGIGILVESYQNPLNHLHFDCDQ